MKVKLASLSLSLFLFGCAAPEPISDETYIHAGVDFAAAHRCFQLGHTSPQSHAEVLKVVSRWMRNPRFDSDKFEYVVQSTGEDPEFKSIKKAVCRNVEATFLSLADDYKISREKISTAPAQPNSVQCTKLMQIGINREIKTFTGAICPFGWVPS